MQADRTATVLFAEPGAESRRNEASRQAVTAALIGIAESTGGRMVKTVGGKLMAVFASPDAAASAASKIQARIDALPPVGGIKPGVQVGFHTGPLVKGGRGVADDTIKLALQLLAQARDGQTVTTLRTAARLNPAFRNFSRPLRSAAARPEDVCELASWHQKGVRPQGWAAMALLTLSCGEQIAVCSREKEQVVLGREDDCDLVLVGKAASRRHCTVEYVRGDFVVRDHSSNGTFLRIAQAAEIALHNETLALPEQGVISVGEPHERSSEPIAFWYALVT